MALLARRARWTGGAADRNRSEPIRLRAALIRALIESGWFDAGEASYVGATNLAGSAVGSAASCLPGWEPVALPIISSHPLSLVLSSVGVGGLAIGVTSLASGRVGELVLPEHRPQIWGRMTIVFAIVYAATAYVLSFLFVRTGSYELLFALGAGALLVGGLLGFLPPRPVCPRGEVARRARIG